MQVTISKRVVDKAKKEAKRLYPNECFIDLYGTTVSDDVVAICDYSIPDFTSDSEGVWLTDSWPKCAYDNAKALGLSYIGTCHSHCYAPQEGHGLSPSEVDWDNIGDKFIGVVSVLKRDSGRFDAKFRLYPPLTKLTCTIV